MAEFHLFIEGGQIRFVVFCVCLTLELHQDVREEGLHDGLDMIDRGVRRGEGEVAYVYSISREGIKLICLLPEREILQRVVHKVIVLLDDLPEIHPGLPAFEVSLEGETIYLGEAFVLKVPRVPGKIVFSGGISHHS